MPFWRLFYHVVWATRGRAPLIDAARTEVVMRAVKAAGVDKGVMVHGVGIMPDHVHVAASIPPALAVAAVVGRWKGSSSHLLNHGVADDGVVGIVDGGFAWQAEYGVVSFCERHLPDVLAYVANQPARHADRKLWPLLEEIAPAPTP